MLVAIQRADGGLSIMNVAPRADVNAEIDKWKTAHPNEYVSHAAVTDTAIPADRAYRNAWRLNAGNIEHDMTKARALHLTGIRAKRNAMLDATDKLMLKATETNDVTAVAELKALRQRLRDIPADIMASVTAARDTAELKAITSTALDDAAVVVGPSRAAVRA